MKRSAIALGLLLAASLAWAQDGAPADYDALIARAHEHARAGRTAEADAALLQAIEVAETDARRAAAIFTLGVSCEGRRDIDGAIEVFARAIDLEDGGEWQRRSLQRLGWQAERRRETETARRAWERLLEIVGEDSPHAGEALIALARIARRDGRLDEAIAHLEALLKHEAHQTWRREAQESLSALLVQRGDYERALEVAREIADESRRMRMELQVADRMLDAGDAERAGQIAREVLATTPGYLSAMRLAYRAATDRGALDELRRELRAEAAGDAPEGALEFLAEIASWEDDPLTAVEHLRKLAALRPQDAEVRVRLGQTALDADLLDEADAALREALRLDPNLRSALITLAEALVRRGRTDEAIAQLKLAVGYDPTEESTVRSLDQALRRNSLHHARVESITEARAATGDQALMAYELARVYVDLLQYDDATREFLRALGDEGVPARAVGMELERLVTDEIAGADVLAAVRAYLQAADGLPDAERLALARVLLAAGDREGAAKLLEGVASAGSAVADLAREAQFRGDADLAAELFAMALGMDLPEPERADVALSLARLQQDTGAWRLALQTLGAPALGTHPEALLMRARLLTSRAHDLDAARRAWEALLTCAADDPRYVAAAREGMADWLFAGGQLDEAERAYTELAGRLQPAESPFLTPWGDLPPLPPGMLPPGGLALALPGDTGPDPAWAALRLAEIALRRGDLKEAEVRFRFVVDEHALSAYANDALDRLAFMRDNLDGKGGAEARYFDALGLTERGDPGMARDLLLEIAGTRDEPLADDALVALGELRLDQGDARAAAETWLSVAERFPDSMLAPGALLRAADLLRGELADASGAAAALRRVTDDYSDSAAADEARAALELLPGSG